MKAGIAMRSTCAIRLLEQDFMSTFEEYHSAPLALRSEIRTWKAECSLPRCLFECGKLPVHRQQELLIVAGALHLAEKEFHRFVGVHVAHVLPQYPNALKFLFLHQKIF